MNDTTSPESGPDQPDSVLAGEYVLRLLPAAEHRAAEERLATSGAFRALVARWHEDFIRLTDLIREVQPPDALRHRLASFVLGEAGPVQAPSGRRLSTGRILAGVMGGLAVAGLALVLILGALPWVGAPTEGPIYTAEIAGEDAPFLVEARYDPARGTLILERSAGAPAGPGRVLQLWLLPEGATSPVSLGLLPEGVDTTLDLPPELGDAIPHGLLEISEEPEGGSPEAGPTGPVLGLGRVAPL